MVEGSRGNESWDIPVNGPEPGPSAEGDSEFSETTSKSWFERLKEALGGILTGLAFVLVSIVLLFWNEGRAVKTANALSEGAGQVVEAKAQTLDRSLDGKLVHVSGALQVATPPRDADFDVSATALRLDRKVEMYQWRENKSSRTEKKLGGGEETITTYSYTRVWSDTEQRSDGFRQQQGHTNPFFPQKSKTFAGSARLGAYEIGADHTGGLGTSTPLALESRQAGAIGAKLGRPVIISDGLAYAGRDPAQPQVGDLRISYAMVKADQASVVAAQKGAELVPFVASNGRSIFLGRAGTASAADMFENAQQGNTMITWLLRAVGLFLAIAGFKLILRIASVIADVVPIFGTIVGAGTGFVAILLGICQSMLVAGVAWIFYRPLIGLGLLAIGGLALALLWQRARAAGPVARLAPA